MPASSRVVGEQLLWEAVLECGVEDVGRGRLLILQMQRIGRMEEAFMVGKFAGDRESILAVEIRSSFHEHGFLSC